MPRIQVVVDESERDAFRAQAGREGKSLSEWLREAGRERIERMKPHALKTRQEMEEFFSAVDARHAGEPHEDDWPVHKARIASSRTAGLPEGS